MTIKELFTRDINRPINGVVKAEQLDDASVWQELDEFVVTKELGQHLRKFFGAYTDAIDHPNDPTISGKMGVWISGFFGSGKSHFLKVLSYVLGNRLLTASGQSRRTVEFFETKIHDAMLYGDIKRSVASNTDVILFNIDSKADSRSGGEAILTVFLRVFNEMLGYSGDHPWIAHMERYLDSKHKLDTFHAAYKLATGNKWLDERDAYAFNRDAVVKALSHTLGQSEEASNKWFDNMERSLALTIENFCGWVKEYLDSKGPNHRLIFLVDEMGQFVGGQNPQRMLNLQTITEDLGTFCDGRAWLIVTSQEDIDSVIGEMKKSAANDFSKIQARFKTRLSLSSANVDEVIQKRLLAKRDEVVAPLQTLHATKGDIIKNQLSFTNVGPTLKSFKDADDFVLNYPFAPYQFQLVQKVFEAIRKAGATGLHLSRGERSILDAFQSAAKQIADEAVDVLVPFWRFYPSIESFLDTSVKRTIDQAETNPSLEPFDIRLLQVLFLIRYVEEIKGNVNNLVTLCIDEIDADRLALRQKIEESLQRLEKETLINRSGDNYFFLTNEERDISREIKSVDLSSGEEAKLLGELIFDEVLKGNRKHRYAVNGKDFPFNCLCDLHPVGRRVENGLVISVVSPLADDYKLYDNARCIFASTNEGGQILLRLNDDESLGRELRSYLKTEKYISRKNDGSLPKTTLRILHDCADDNRGRRERLVNLLSTLLLEATYYAAGSKVTLKSDDAAGTMNQALDYLIQNTFPKMGLLKRLNTDPQREIQAVLRSNDIAQQTLAVQTEEANPQALDELRGYVDLCTRASRTIVLHEMIETRYAIRPYGWPDLEVVLLVVRLVVVGEIQVVMNGAVVPTEKVYGEISAQAKWRKITIVQRRNVDTKLLQATRALGKDVFSEMGPESEEGLFTFLAGKLKKWDADLQSYKPLADTGNYPGQEEITDGLRTIARLLAEEDSFKFIERFNALKPELLELADGFHDLKNFYDYQKPAWEKLRKASERFQLNRLELERDAKAAPALKRIHEILNAPSPYNLIKEGEGLIQTVSVVNDALVSTHRAEALKTIDAQIAEIGRELEAVNADAGLKPACLQPLQDLRNQVEREQSLAHVAQAKAEAVIQRLGFDQVMEAMAYTWFNRFVALCYMELHGYLDHGYRVLSHPDKGKTIPEILEHAEHVTLPGLDAQQVINLKLDGSREAELYRLLLVAQCNALHEAMPFLFEKIADETELLLPANLLHSDSLIRKLVNELDEADWQQVEIIGWLYQFYISDKKDEVIGKVVKSEDIPAATQLFTPNWIVKYLIQNTLGRQWLATYPDSPLRHQMEYYIEPAEQTEDVITQIAAITPKSLDPEKLTLLDPASGSGHILVEAYDVFKAIYQERGYRSKDIPRLILEKNLFGLEIDDRAAQLAAFALLMKARADDRRIFADHVQPNVIAIQESKGLEHLLRPDPTAAKGAGEQMFADSDLFPQTEKQLTLTKPNQESPLAAVEPCLRELFKLFEHGKTFGSLIRVPPSIAALLPAARQSIEAMITNGQLWEHRAATLLLPLMKQAELLVRLYDIVVTNPPYIGSKFHIPVLRVFLEANYKGYEKDLFSAFIDRNLGLSRSHGHLGFMSPQVWMFLSSYQALRLRLIDRETIMSLVQPEYNAFWDSAHVTICCYIVQRTHVSDYSGTFIRLTDFYGAELQSQKTLQAIKNPDCGWLYKAKQDEFKKIPGSPLAYWIKGAIRKIFEKATLVGEITEVRQGLATGENDRFLRLWHELSIRGIRFGCLNLADALRSGLKWFPYNKGGDFRKWYGNHWFVVNWKDDGREIREFGRQDGGKPRSRAQSTQFYFAPSVSWSKITSSGFAMRSYPLGFIFDVAGCSIFGEKTASILGCMNSAIMTQAVNSLSPTLNFEVGQAQEFPFMEPKAEKTRMLEVVDALVSISKSDWNAYERSWEFQCLPIMTVTPNSTRTLESSYTALITTNRETIANMKCLEEENNRLFIGAYGLDGELTPGISIEQITLTINPAYRYGDDLTEEERWTRFRQDTMKEIVSYIIGCVMGRYSLDKLGLVYSQSRNEGFDASQYQTFPADADGIIPITELAWFPDDATERFVEFIGKAWPDEHLEENLKFIADSLGANRDEHPRDTIRRYVSQNFYKDHLQTYKRRPIYWLFSSGKQKAFQCLVYLHRYHEGTLARMRTEYVIPLQGKLSQRIDQLAGDSTAATSTSHRRKLEKERETLVKQRTELTAFDEKLRHYADQRIALDLDDGVKVNYAKFGDLLAEIKAVTGGTEE